METYKRIQVVMLPTNEKSYKVKQILLIGYGDNKRKLKISPWTDSEGKLGSIFQEQHLYFISDEEIKEGDWYIDDTNTIRKSITSDKEYWEVRKDYKKIIATTNSSLKWCMIGFSPQPPQNFIEAFVTKYNEGNKIEWVNVEYEFDNIGHRENPGFHNQKLKVNSKNEIIIKTNF